MLQIEIPDQEFFDDEKQEFIIQKGQKLQLEHSLVSISKWESKWKKPFLGRKEKSEAEVQDYIRCMTITQHVPDDVYKFIPSAEMIRVKEYIDDSMTATTFRDDGNKKSNDIVTAEIIYYWMISFNIPFECQKWHLNRLLALIKVCGIKNSPKKKMSRKAQAQRNTSLNALRKNQFGTRG